MIARIKRLESNDAVFGVLCILIATLGLSMKAIFIKLVYAEEPGIDAASILVIRFLLALPFFLVLLYYFKPKLASDATSFKQILSLLFLGTLGFYVAAVLDFSALAYIPASLERLILFLYPTFVVLISVFVRPKEVTRKIVLALVLSYLGIIIVFSDQALIISSQMTKGIILVFAAAMVFAVYTVLSVKQIHFHGTILFTSYAMIAATIISVIHAYSLHGAHIFEHSLDVYGLILPMAIFSTTLPLLLMAEGVKRIGASSASVISTSGPVLTLIMAYFILGETFGLLQIMGGLMIVLGVFLVGRRAS